MINNSNVFVYILPGFVQCIGKHFNQNRMIIHITLPPFKLHLNISVTILEVHTVPLYEYIIIY